MAPLVILFGCATGGADGGSGYVVIGESPEGQRTLLLQPVQAGQLTSEFGKRIDPLDGRLRYHKGIDYGAPIGTPVQSAGDGLVMEVGARGGYGNYVIVRHDDVYATSYAHLMGFADGLQPGGRITQGEVIGYVGQTGRASEPHLHYEILADGEQVDPLGLSFDLAKLKGRAMDAASSLWVGLNGVSGGFVGGFVGGVADIVDEHVLTPLDRFMVGLRDDDCAESCDPYADLDQAPQ